MEPKAVFEHLFKENIARRGLRTNRAYDEAVESLRLILDVDDLDDVPDPICVARHLPPGRDPTAGQLDAAFNACRKKK